MGPPGETPRRSSRLIKTGALSLSSLGFLESPSEFPSGFPSGFYNPEAFMSDTPSRLMHLDPPLTKGAKMTVPLGSEGEEGVRFDFDEAVAAHFPSPRAGEQLKGSSPYRWSGGSVGSQVSALLTLLLCVWRGRWPFTRSPPWFCALEVVHQ